MASYQYTLNGPLLEITCSDSQREHVDQERIPDIYDHPDGRERLYIEQSDDSRLSKAWRKKLGNTLAIKFLLKPDNSMYPIFLSSKLLLIRLFS
jgi:hypothetical protein